MLSSATRISVRRATRAMATKAPRNTGVGPSPLSVTAKTAKNKTSTPPKVTESKSTPLGSGRMSTGASPLKAGGPQTAQTAADRAMLESEDSPSAQSTPIDASVKSQKSLENILDLQKETPKEPEYLRLSARLMPVPPARQTWLTRLVRRNRTWERLFTALVWIMGYGSAKQTSGRRMYHLYAHTCAASGERAGSGFWIANGVSRVGTGTGSYATTTWTAAAPVAKAEGPPTPKPKIEMTPTQTQITGLGLPPTFQSFFLITNLHCWMLAVRLRALPSQAPLQSLIDHFFLDIEDRIRRVLQPPKLSKVPSTAPSTSAETSPSELTYPPHEPEPYTILTPALYPVPPPGASRAPETLVSRQMKVFRDQWQGMWVSLDYAVGLQLKEGQDINVEKAVGGEAGGETADGVLAAALWRNLMDGRMPELESTTISSESLSPPPPDVVATPKTLLALVQYTRRELKRLEEIPDSVFLEDGIPEMCRRVGAWGPVPGTSHSRAVAQQDAYLEEMAESVGRVEPWEKQS